MENSLPLSGYLLRELTAQVDLKTQEGRSALLKHAQPLLTAIAAPTTALLLRKEVAALAGVEQAELEALWALKPIAAPQRQLAQRVKRATPSAHRAILRCLVMQPELAHELPPGWQGEGAEGAAILALADWLRESADETSTSALIQHFQGTAHEMAFAVAQAEIMHFGQDFDVITEFADILNNLRREAVSTEMSMLQEKGLGGMSEAERARYEELSAQLRRSKTASN